jgi:hypothetical protein
VSSEPGLPVITYKKYRGRIGIFEVVEGDGYAKLEWLGYL